MTRRTAVMMAFVAACADSGPNLTFDGSAPVDSIGSPAADQPRPSADVTSDQAIAGDRAVSTNADAPVSTDLDGPRADAADGARVDGPRADTRPDTAAVPSDAPLGTCGTAPGTFKKVTDLVYVPASGSQAHKLDLYIPDGPGPFPLIVWIHGGGWRTGSKAICPVSYQASRGYVVASMDYRLSNEARFPAQVHDVKAAIRWLRANAATHKIATDQVGVTGASAGGHLASLLATSAGVAALEDLGQGNPGVSSRAQAATPFYGASDFLQMNAQARAAGCPLDSPDHDAVNSPESLLIGCAIQTCPDRTRAANPITYITPDDPPFLIEHGDKDCTVPPGQSQLLYDALRAAGLAPTLMMIADQGHGGAPYNRTVLDEFFDRHLRGCQSR